MKIQIEVEENPQGEKVKLVCDCGSGLYEVLVTARGSDGVFDCLCADCGNRVFQVTAKRLES